MTLRDKIRQLLKSDFNKHFFVLISGTSISQLVPLLASVVLARIYSPEDFGILAIFTSLVSIFTSVNNLRYEFAIPLPTEDKDAVILTFLSGIIAIGFSIALFIIALLFKTPILKLIGGEQLGNWIYAVPLAIFFWGIYSPLNYFALRFKKYKLIASSNILRSSSSAGLQLGFGLAGFTQAGLILGSVFSSLFGNAGMTRLFLKFKESFKDVTRASLKRNAIRYKKFPIFSIWGIFLNNLSANINSFFISNLYGLGQLGFYSYGTRYLSIPLTLIGNNMGQLFYQVCADCHKNNLPATKEFLSTLKKLVILGFPLFFVLFFTIEDLSAFVFGEQWRIAGYYSKILLPLFFIRTVYAPLSQVSGAFEKQELSLRIQIAIFLTNMASFVTAYLLKCSITTFLILYCTIGSVVYIILGYILFLIASKKIR
jgi:O-antigen/teichoic acid export membrane protein